MPAPKDPIKREEWLHKMRVASLGRRHSEETRERLSVIGKKRTHTEISRAKISESLRGKRTNWHHSEESKFKISMGLIGKMPSKDTREKLKFASTGKSPSLDCRKKISDSMKIWWANLPLEEKKKNFDRLNRQSNNLPAISSIEHDVARSLREINEQFTQQHFYHGFYIDFYLPQRNQFIECNGEYWHHLPKRIKRDNIVAMHCKNDGIKLSTLWEGEIRKNAMAALESALSE